MRAGLFISPPQWTDSEYSLQWSSRSGDGVAVFWRSPAGDRNFSSAVMPGAPI